MRTFCYSSKEEKEKTKAGLIKKHEQKYKVNFFKAKAAAFGTLDTESVQPTFSKEEANTFYKERYSKPVEMDPANLAWFPEAGLPQTPLDSSPILPCHVKKILSGKSPTSAPGEDGLMYGVLAKLPSVHHFLATKYNKTQDSSLAPKSWAGCRIVLCHKAGSTDDPANFRPLALSSCLGKPYHCIKAQQMADFMVANGYINTITQKAFLQGINGSVEHIKVLQEIIQDAKANK